MALPQSFSTSQEYFKKSVKFLKCYCWIYKYSNVRFLKEGVLSCFPREFEDYFLTVDTENLNKFPLIHDYDITLEYSVLYEFREALKELVPTEKTIQNEDFQIAVGQRSVYKMNSKKQHETHKLAQLINEICDRNQTLFVDFGCGLGYLGEVLYNHNRNIYLLGLEVAQDRVKTAQKRLHQYMPEAKDTIQYRQELITESTVSLLSTSFEESHPQMAIIGLHACADLSITAMQIFFRLGHIKKLIIMPCCYHKLRMNTPTRFASFPLSEALKNVLKTEQDYDQYLNRPFLRLACQQTAKRWNNISAEQHYIHGKEMFERAVVEAILDEGEFVSIRRTGKKVRNSCRNLCSFATVCEEFELRSQNPEACLKWGKKHENKFDKIMLQYNHKGVQLTEGLACLQTAMQKLCENIVLYDRLCFMREQAEKYSIPIDVRFQKILDEGVSPRCYVLIAEKL